jgi:hypothetical protein
VFISYPAGLFFRERRTACRQLMKEYERFGRAREWDRKHQDAIERKYQRLGGLQANLEEWEAMPPNNQNRRYIRDLKVRIRSIEAQLKAMKP